MKEALPANKQMDDSALRERIQTLYRESAKYVPCQNHGADEYYRIMAEIIRLEKMRNNG